MSKASEKQFQAGELLANLPKLKSVPVFIVLVKLVELHDERAAWDARAVTGMTSSKGIHTKYQIVSK